MYYCSGSSPATYTTPSSAPVPAVSNNQQSSQDSGPPPLAPTKEQTEPVDFSSSQTPNFGVSGAGPRGFETGVAGVTPAFPRGPSPAADSLTARYRNGEWTFEGITPLQNVVVELVDILAGCG